MSQKTRAETVRAFSNNPSVRIILISLRYSVKAEKIVGIIVLKESDLLLTYFLFFFFYFFPFFSLFFFSHAHRAGGVGLNLTVASVVVLMDPWFNPSTEDQAIDRCILITTVLFLFFSYFFMSFSAIHSLYPTNFSSLPHSLFPSLSIHLISHYRVHRLGQCRDVEVYRLICKDTVEERLLALQVTNRIYKI